MKVWLWCAPAVVLLGAFSAYPLIYAVQLSVSGADGISLSSWTRLLSDSFLPAAALHTAIYCAAALLLELILGVALALLADTLTVGRSALRTALLIPMLLPPVVAAVIWRLIYNPQFGLLNGTLRQAGVPVAGLTWTSGENQALASVIAVDVWQWAPFFFLIASAALQTIPREPLEAARMDGAGWWQTHRDIVLPLLRPALAAGLLIRSLDLLRVFDTIFLLTQGGPGFATETLNLYIYRTGFRFQNFSYASAMSLALLAFTLALGKAAVRRLR